MAESSVGGVASNFVDGGSASSRCSAGAAPVGTADSRERSRSPRRKGKKNVAASAKKKSADTPALASDMVAKAMACLAKMPPRVKLARRLFESALKAEPENVEVLDAFGAFLGEEGDGERAVELLERSVALRPDTSAEKYLCLAQLTSGEQALGHYEKAAAVLKRSIATEAEASRDTKALRSQLATMQAAVAELFMTDLCDLPEAESRCEEALQCGFDAYNASLEVMATKASLRKVQGNMEEAKELALSCAKRVASTIRQYGMVFDDKDADTTVEDETLGDEDIVQLCRTLIDLLEASEARGLLEVLLEKDDEDIQVWCLLGFCHVTEKDGEAALECAEEASRLCKKIGQEAEVWRPALEDLIQRAKQLEPSAEPTEE
eukprot:TRINITY_DN67300_c0_g1_i1.p1 TRINITY_DN67300_c0_g1~~TRINITY_DN67300_c0_g1_i1.p1  ORF type:complete len:399 (-),score=110.81 TRINITY_DN67300_c0_g1_i1:92-1225(-)